MFACPCVVSGRVFSVDVLAFLVVVFICKMCGCLCDDVGRASDRLPDVRVILARVAWCFFVAPMVSFVVLPYDISMR